MPCADILTVWPALGRMPRGLVDTAAMEFLGDALREVDDASGGPNRLVPISVTGDGNCLAHSISRACHGEEVWYSLLRKKISQELRENEAWYLEHLPHVTKEEFEREVVAAETLGEYMDAGTGLHLLAMANTVGRPIVLMASRQHMEDPVHSNCKFSVPVHVSVPLSPRASLPRALSISSTRGCLRRRDVSTTTPPARQLCNESTCHRGLADR